MNFELPQPVLDYLLDSTVMASLLVLLVGLLQITIGRRLSPGWRFVLWTPVLLRLLIPVFPESSLSLHNLLQWGARDHEAQAVARPLEVNPGTQGPVLIQMERLTEEERSQRVLHDWPILLGRMAFLLWLMVAGGLLLRLMIGTLWLQWKLRGCPDPSGELQQILEKAANDLHLSRSPGIRETSLVDNPALFGLLRPCLLLPPGFSDRLDPREVRHVFLHEVAHLKRRDLLVNWLMAIAQAIHWFNPLVWLAFRQMRMERELACDAMALRAASGENPQQYGRTILRLLEGVTARPRLAGLVGIAEEKHSAKRRLQQIATFRPGHRKYWLALPILLLLAVAGLTNAEDPGIESEPPLNLSFYLVADEIPSQDLVTGNVDPHTLSLAKPPFFSPRDILAYDPSNGVLEVTAEGARRFSVQLFGKPTTNAEGKQIYQLWSRSNLPIVTVDPKGSRHLAILHNPLSSFRYPGMQELSAEVASIDSDQQGSVRFRFSLNAEKDLLPTNRRSAETQSGNPYNPTTDALSLPTPKAGSTRDKEAMAEKLRTTIIPEFLVPEGERLGIVLNRLTQASASTDVVNDRIQFYMREDAGGQDPEYDQPRLLNYILPEMSFSNTTLAKILQRILATAKPHTSEQAPMSISYSIEAHGVMIHAEPGAEPLHTRTYRLNAAAFLKVLENSQGPIPSAERDNPADQHPALQLAVRKFFALAGIEFPALRQVASSAEPDQLQKAIFFNDRSGILFVRAPLSDLDKVEKVLIELHLPSATQPQLTIETLAVQFQSEVAFKQFMNRLERLQTQPGAVLTKAEFNELREDLEKTPGTDILKLPRITTLSGRAARVSVADIGKSALVLDLNPEYLLQGEVFKLEAAAYREDDSENKRTQSGVLYNGQTLILGLPDSVEHFPDRTTNVPHLYFITPILIDVAGNLIKNPGDPREDLPPQR